MSGATVADGKWPARHDDPEWVALCELAGPLDNEAAKRELGVDIEAELRRPRIPIEDVIARGKRRPFLQLEEDFCCLCREPHRHLIDTCIGRECCWCWVGNEPITTSMDRVWQYAVGVDLREALSEAPGTHEEIVRHRTALRGDA